MKILALDLGKRKSVGCVYDSETAEHRFVTLDTAPGAFHVVIAELSPDRVVFEIGPAAGWIGDLLRAMGMPMEVANVAHQAWRWRNTITFEIRLLKQSSPGWPVNVPIHPIPDFQLPRCHRHVVFRTCAP